MFIGHYAVALVAKRFAPRTSLGVLFAAAQLPDLVWPVGVLLGLEQVAIVPGITAFNPLDFTSYPWSHSFVMVAIWAVVAGAVYSRWSRDRTGAFAVSLLVGSHWILDWFTHRPDLALWPGDSPRVGLGLWQSVAGTFLLESAMYLAGVVIYLRATRALDGIGRYAVQGLLLLLAGFYVADRFGPPPPNETFLGWFALVGGVAPVVWAAWGDWHRTTVAGINAARGRGACG